ncbi:hypothetical protein FRB96_003013 [Tulasnella sp. 330]|nr:hypothetical protein FRB96_003013 [Tulasnella sp. 330]
MADSNLFMNSMHRRHSYNHMIPHLQSSGESFDGGSQVSSTSQNSIGGFNNNDTGLYPTQYFPMSGYQHGGVSEPVFHYDNPDFRASHVMGIHEGNFLRHDLFNGVSHGDAGLAEHHMPIHEVGDFGSVTYIRPAHFDISGESDPNWSETRGHGDMAVGPQMASGNLKNYLPPYNGIFPLPGNDGSNGHSGYIGGSSQKWPAYDTSSHRLDESEDAQRQLQEPSRPAVSLSHVQHRQTSRKKGSQSQTSPSAHPPSACQDSNTSLRKPLQRPRVRRDPYARTNVPSASIPRPVTDPNYFTDPASSLEMSRTNSSSVSFGSYERGKPRNKWIPQSLLYFSNSAQLTAVQPLCRGPVEASAGDRQLVRVPAPPCIPGAFTPLGVADVSEALTLPGGGVTPMPLVRRRPTVVGEGSEASSSRGILSCATIPTAGPTPSGIEARSRTTLRETNSLGGASSRASVAGQHYVPQAQAIQDALDLDKVWYEERDSGRRCGASPYHPNHWSGVLPGPGITDVHG